MMSEEALLELGCNKVVNPYQTGIFAAESPRHV